MAINNKILKLILILLILIGIRIKTTSASIPAYGKLFWQQGMDAENKHNIPRALSLYQKAVSYNPAHAPSYYRLGIIYDGLLKPDQSLEAFRKVAELKTWDGYYLPAYWAVGMDYFNKEEYLKAIECFRWAVKQNNHFSPAYYHIGLSYLALKDYLSASKQLINLHNYDGFWPGTNYEKKLGNLLRGSKEFRD
jgi:tetratricopeptide (TPR) repeat protein